MTKRSSRRLQSANTLKALLLAGSVLATLAGTRILARQEPVTQEMPGVITVPVTVVVPAGDSETLPLPPTLRRTQLNLAPIPQSIQPQLHPIARTRSSR